MKNFLIYLISLTLIFITFFNITNNFNNNFISTKFFLEKKNEIINSKYNLNKARYQITNSNTDLINGLISKGGNTDGKEVIKTKIKDLSKITLASLKININLNIIDLKESYYVLVNIDGNNNFNEIGKRIKILSKEFIINDKGIYYLHLSNVYSCDYDSFLEIGYKYWKLRTVVSSNFVYELEDLTWKLNVIFNFNNFYFKRNELIIWLNHYQFDSDYSFNESLKFNGKGFNLTINHFLNGYRDFLDPVDYDKNPQENINIKKLDSSIKRIANEYLQFSLFKIESKINMHNYNLNQILNGRKLPQTKLEINNYEKGKSFGKWLQDRVNFKFYFWKLTVNISIGSLIILFMIITFVILFYMWKRKIYQPLLLKELRFSKKQIQYFKKNKLIFNTYRFIKLTKKSNKYFYCKKTNFDTFLLIQEIFQTNLNNIEYKKYDNIFYCKKNQIFLSGEKFINIFLNCKNINDYNKIFQTSYINCFYNKFHKNLLTDILNFYLNKNKNKFILSLENNFNIDEKMQLVKIRQFLENQEWKYYFFDLQNLMHKTLINFLKWNNKPLNFSAYCKTLKRKLFWILQSESEVQEYLEVIQTINFYRNLLSKALPLQQNKLIEWNELSEKAKKDLSWKVYFSLLDFINFTNMYVNK